MTRPPRSIALVLCLLWISPVSASPSWPFSDNPLIRIAAGSFVFGADDGEANEAPRAVLRLPAFSIARTEVTNDQYRRLVRDTGHRPSFFADHPVLGLGAHPVVGVSWDDADAFCRHFGLALPSERQWERAARGTDGRRFAWGDAAPGADRVNRGAEICCAADAADGFAATAPVGSFPAGHSPEGVADLTGNVWEWVDGWYNPYDAAAPAQSFRVLRGGAWNSDAWKLRTTYRLAYDPAFRFAANGGFRCAGVY